MWIGATANMTAHARAALASYLSNRMEGPTFQNRGQLFVSFLYLNTVEKLAPILNVHKVSPERISQACPKNFCSKFFVVAFVSSWANLKTNLGSYTPGNLQLQASVLQHQRISCKAPAFTSRPRLCGEGAEQRFKIHTFYSGGV